MSVEVTPASDSQVVAPVDETAKFVTSVSDAPAIKPAQAELETKTDVTQTELKPDLEKASNEQTQEGLKDDKTSSDTASEDDSTANGPEKKKGGFQKRIEKLAKQREEQRIKAETLQTRNDELEQKLKDKNDKTEKEKNRPREGDFDSYDDFLDAVEAFGKPPAVPTKEPVKELKTEVESSDTGNSELTDTQRIAMSVVQEKIVDAVANNPDFEKIALADDVDINGGMLEALAECDNLETVMMTLGNDKKLASKIAALTPVQQMREITKLDVSSNRPQKPDKKVSTASQPISPVHASDSQEKPLGELSFSEYEAKMNKAEQAKGGSSW